MIVIDTQLVRELISAQFPEWKDLEIRPVIQSGHDNRTFHLGERMTVRLPSGDDYVAQIEKETKWLPILAKNLSLPISSPIALGTPSNNYPFPWSINRYIEGETVSERNVPDKKRLAGEISGFLRELQRINTEEAPVAGEHNFYRGANPAVYHNQVEKALQERKKRRARTKNKGCLGTGCRFGMGKTAGMDSRGYCSGKPVGKRRQALRRH